MTEKSSPESPGAVQERLKYLKEKKAVLDEMIECLERYAVYCSKEERPARPDAFPRRLAGAA